jgi:hypothetical protein
VVDGLELRVATGNRVQPRAQYRTGTVILVNINMSINSNVAILQRAVRVLYSNHCQGLNMSRKYNMAILIICVVLRYLTDDHYRKMRVLRPGGLTNLPLMTSRSILALALSQPIILDLSTSLSS